MTDNLIKKWARHFMKIRIQIVNKHLKRFSSSLVGRKFKSKLW